MLRLLFLFSFSSFWTFTYADQNSSNHTCQVTWQYLARESICILFATSEVGDVSWDNSHRACQKQSSELLTLENATRLQAVQEIFNEIESNEPLYSEFIRQGAWIRNSNLDWLADDLCDSTRTTIEDLQWSCVILTRRTNHQSLCLKRALCSESHPFICQNTRMLDDSSTADPMQWPSVRFLPFIGAALGYIVGTDKRKKAQAAAAAAAAAADIKEYKNLFDFDIPEAFLVDDGQALAQSSGGKLTIAGFKISPMVLIIGGGLLIFIIMCVCCTVCICLYKKFAH